ncbi:hypothetical protein GUJ93_ZPchr0006g44607 [Zizania palustris]|uniref:Uncharacterized protein n=1 Tax=Zizania palustris TaxID=103762 RepID=A0A8J5T7J1_ZIZPA|nr:hypothetical protein GUJ93_ZPchr0006g44607 [Zizania palustris]
MFQEAVPTGGSSQGYYPCIAAMGSSDTPLLLPSRRRPRYMGRGCTRRKPRSMGRGCTRRRPRSMGGSSTRRRPTTAYAGWRC